MSLIGIVADDLTGATTCAALLARSNTGTVIITNGKVDECDETASNPQALVVSSNTRTMEMQEAYCVVRSITMALRKKGVKYFSKRIDTTLRGCLGAEIDAMMDVLGKDTLAVVVPAMPQSRRIMVGGYSIIDGVALVETDAAHDALSPVYECYVPRLLQNQTKHKVGLVELDDVLIGSEHIMKCIAKLRDNGCEIIAVDAVSINHVDEIAKACVALDWNIVAVDPGAFTRQLAFHRGFAKEEKPRFTAGHEPAKNKTVIVVAGSASEVTKRQIAMFCREPSTVQIPVDRERLIGTSQEAEKEISAVVQLALSHLNSDDCPKGIVFGTACFGERMDLDLEDSVRGYSKGGCAERINQGLGVIVRLVLEKALCRVAGIYCTGGDTLAAVCNALDVTCLEAVDYLIPQTDITRMTGRYAGMTLIGKGGLTGDDNIVKQIVHRILMEAGSSNLS